MFAVVVVVVVVSDEPFCKTLVHSVLVRPTFHLQRHDDAPLGDEIHGQFLNCSDLYLKLDPLRQVWVHGIASFDMQQSPTLPSALSEASGFLESSNSQKVHVCVQKLAQKRTTQQMEQSRCNCEFSFQSESEGDSEKTSHGLLRQCCFQTMPPLVLATRLGNTLFLSFTKLDPRT